MLDVVQQVCVPHPNLLVQHFDPKAQHRKRTIVWAQLGKKISAIGGRKSVNRLKPTRCEQSRHRKEMRGRALTTALTPPFVLISFNLREVLLHNVLVVVRHGS